MEITLPTQTKIDAKYLTLDVGVRYWEDGTFNGLEDSHGEICCSNGQRWQPIIDINDGKIINWDIGNTAEIHYKVCDDGLYKIINENREIIAEVAAYVPDFLAVGERSLGDYIIFNIDENGFIEGWKCRGKDLENLIKSAF